MATRYWIPGGLNRWTTTSTANWSSSSGGSSGASIPTSSDDVVFDSNSGSGTVFVAPDSVCRNFNASSFSGVFDGLNSDSNLGVYGDMTIGAAASFDTFCNLNIYGTCALTTNAVELEFGATFGLRVRPGASVTLQDDLAVALGSSSQSLLIEGSFDANDHNVSAERGIAITGSSARTILMGSGTWTLQGNGSNWNATGTNVTLNAEGSTIRALGSGSITFNGGGHSYNILRHACSTLNLNGDNSFEELIVEPPVTVASRAVAFLAGSTQTVGSFESESSSGVGKIRLVSQTTGTRWRIRSSGGVTCDYCEIQDSDAGGGADWIAGDHSINFGNNVGWIFPGASGGQHRMFAVF